MWDAVREWHGGTLLEIQASLVEGGTPAGMLVEPYKGAVDMYWDGTGDVTTTTTTVFGAKYDVQFKTESGRRVIEVRARDVKYATSDRNAATSMAYLIASSPKLVTVSTGGGRREHAVLGCGHGSIVVAVDDGDTVMVADLLADHGGGGAGAGGEHGGACARAAGGRAEVHPQVGVHGV